MKLCTRHKLALFVFLLTFALLMVLYFLGYDSVFTTYSVTNGIEKIVYTPIGKAATMFAYGMLSISVMWEFTIRGIDKKIAAEPELKSHQIHKYFMNGFFFVMTFVFPIACIATLLLS